MIRTGGLVTIRIYAAPELHGAVPGAVFTDGDTSVILLNPDFLDDQTAWLREVINSLLDEASSGPRPALSAVG